MKTQVSPAELRIWAKANGYEIAGRGRIPGEIREAYTASRRRRGTVVQKQPAADARSVLEVEQLQDSLEQAVSRLGDLEDLVGQLTSRLEALERPTAREQPRRWSRKGTK